MKITSISFLAFVLFTTKAFGQEYEETLLKANKSYESGDQETAKELYFKAAEKGHAEALDCVLETLLFRANSLRLADPQKALALYYEAKKAKPGLSLYDEENMVKVMKMCAAPKGFDTEKFIKKYNVEEYEVGGDNYRHEQVFNKRYR
jgi:hypothetical protein